MIKMYLSMEFNFFLEKFAKLQFRVENCSKSKSSRRESEAKERKRKNCPRSRLRVSIERKKTDPTLSYITHAYVRSSREDETTRLKTQHRVTQWFLNSTFSMNPFVY